jgi:hypothetical protein
LFCSGFQIWINMKILKVSKTFRIYFLIRFQFWERKNEKEFSCII